MHNRRDFVQGTLGTGVLLAAAPAVFARQPLDDVYAQVTAGHDTAVVRLQDWIRQITIAAENRGMEEGCRYMMQLARDAGFQHVERVPTRGFPSVFATLDAGARRTIGVYFMYDVKQVDPAEWSSPPWDARLVDLPGLGRAVMGRGAVNQKGPQASFLAALHAIHAAGRKLPVNLVLIAESEEEIGSPHFADAVLAPQVRAALGKCAGIFMPEAAQSLDGTVTVSLGAKGVVELELPRAVQRHPLLALELRLRARARATKDIDLVLRDTKADLADALEEALTGDAYQGFSVRRKGQPLLLDNGAVNMEFAVTYRGQPWTSISVDIARAEAGESEVEWVEAIALTVAFGVTGPALLPCLPLRFHVAQKLHGLTLPPRPGKQNERFRDLVDLLLMEALVTHDYVALREACELVFRSRTTHPWPPDLATTPAHWTEPFSHLALELDLADTDVDRALVKVRDFVARILRSSA